jgi:DNA-binding transcriptional ArsR family regulator
VLLGILAANTLVYALPQSARIYGTVTDRATGRPINGARIEVLYRGTSNVDNFTISNQTGAYEIAGLEPGSYTVKTTADNYTTNFVDINLASGESLKLNLQLYESEMHGAPAANTSIILIPIILIVFIIVILAAVLSSVGYSKLVKGRILDHNTRKMVYEHIMENPGVHYRAILYNLDLKMGILSHHLKVLENEEYIKSVPDGLYRRYYPKGYVMMINAGRIVAGGAPAEIVAAVLPGRPEADLNDAFVALMKQGAS